MSRSESVRLVFAIAIVGLLLIACDPRDGGGVELGTWVGTITAVGTVTTVVNESGSVWGGTATLVEEASIGVEADADEYMFGLVNSVYATDDRIYVADVQIPAVRVYDNEEIVDAFDAEGRYLGEVEMRPGARPFALHLFIDGRTVVARVEDDAGTIMVKRYRLVLPEER